MYIFFAFLYILKYLTFIYNTFDKYLYYYFLLYVWKGSSGSGMELKAWNLPYARSVCKCINN